ncbi:GlsB/YeaQ/YmgE family stress response membrane protein [Tabrizicola aquatica]|uniref:GlsB/YeaQ/YmgE family stress response membrane protein n=1 Tax=Tabrizicola aquatica TaxID=909926 RepID=UPI000CD17560|nr:GlsB/YeaQ/YmgE family stress response membrane protein [Tabrizicola aquatica]
MAFIWLLVVGAAAGFLATRILKVDLDTPSTIALGVLGALVGGLILRGLTMLAGFGAGIVGALLGALALVWLWKTWTR